MALKKLEENTKSLDFGQGHTGRKRHHNNLSLLLEFSDNVGALVKGRYQSVRGLAFRRGVDPCLTFRREVDPCLTFMRFLTLTWSTVLSPETLFSRTTVSLIGLEGFRLL